jgi:hypothetical protein
MGLKTTTAALGYQQIVGLAASTALTVPTRNPATGERIQPTLAVIVCEGQTVRWRDDKTDPTASVGMPVLANGMLSYDGNLQDIRFIQTAATATLNITYYA